MTWLRATGNDCLLRAAHGFNQQNEVKACT
jgi:hypothetical protein